MPVPSIADGELGDTIRAKLNVSLAKPQFDFATRTDAAAATIPLVANGGPSHIRTGGYATSGDRGHGTYMRTSAPTGYMVGNAGFFQSADGQWWKVVVEPEGVNVIQFGANSQGNWDTNSTIATATTKAFQDAIDYALISKYTTTVVVPVGSYTINGTVWLDPPDNMRVSGAATPARFDFSAALMGQGGLGLEGNGSQVNIWVQQTSGPAIVSGPGQGMTVEGINLLYALLDFSYPPRLRGDATAIGFAISGGNGGATQTSFTRSSAVGFNCGFKVGWNADGLADSNSFYKCVATHCGTGFWFAATQNFINKLDDCLSGGCNIAVRNDLARPVTISGGNYSYDGAFASKLTIGSVSAPTAFTDGSITRYRFTFTVTGGSTGVFTPLSKGNGSHVVMKTNEYGLVPFLVESYNSTTHVMTVALDVDFCLLMFNGGDHIAGWSTLASVIAAQTNAYICELVTTFQGAVMDVDSVHIENAQHAVTRFINSLTTFAGADTAKYSNIFFDYIPTFDDSKTYDDGYEAAFYCQQAIPFIRVMSGHVILENGQTWGGTSALQVSKSQNFNFTVRNLDTPPFNVQVLLDYGNQMEGFHGPDNGYPYEGSGIGAGRYDTDRWVPLHDGRRAGASWAQERTTGPDQCPTIGHHPAPWAVPRLAPADITTIEGALAGSPPALNSAPTPSGQALYQVGTWNSGRQRYALAKHVGSFRTYGQNLTINWEYWSGSRIIKMSSVDWMFPGLKIILNNGADGDIEYVVQQVYLDPGYVVVQRVGTSWGNGPDMGGSADVVGVLGTHYTGSVVKQEPYKIVKYGRQAEFAAALSDLVGRTYQVGDLVWKTNVASAGSPGWVCTTAGTVAVGSGAKFAPLPVCGSEVFA
jgi:hypothetical protein